MGDINCNLLDNELKAHSRRLVDIMDIYQLKLIIKEPTRVTHMSVDLFMTNNPQKIKTNGITRVAISDHYVMYACTKAFFICKPSPKTVESRSFKIYSKIAFESDLSRVINSPPIKEESHPNRMWKNWKSVFVSVANKYAYIKTRKFRNKETTWSTK